MTARSIIITAVLAIAWSPFAFAESPSNQRSVLIIVSQGFHSCKRDESNHLELIQERLDKAEHLRAAYMNVCFTGGMLDDFKDERLYYQIAIDGTWGKWIEGTPDSVTKTMQQVADHIGTVESPTAVYLVGHSHGAWLTLHAAAHWQSGARITRLYTLDPISFVRCTQKYMINLRLTGDKDSDHECGHFPADLLPASKHIRQNIALSWDNYYQRSFPWIRSSANDFADTNTEISDLPSTPRFSAHRRLLNDTRIWNGIVHQIFADLIP